MMLRFSLLLIAAFATAPLAAQESMLTLLVRGADTGGPLPGATLSVGGVRGAADAFGQADLSGVPLGPLALRAEYPGYVALDTTITVGGDGTNLVVLSLKSDAELLGDVVVEAETINDEVLRRRGFFDRRESRTGVFYTREELDQRGANLFSDVFRGVAGVRVQRDGAGTSLVSSRRRGCSLAIFVDGTERAFAAQALDALPFDDVAAVEIYRGPSEVPIEYTMTRTTETCGAVLVWTRMVASDG